jgi:competence protein ComFB
MALEDRFNFEDVVNESERFVREELERQLGGDVDRLTEDEVLDMAALALNNVPPRYRATLLGRLYTQRVDESYRAQVTEAVRSAISKVRLNQ